MIGLWSRIVTAVPVVQYGQHGVAVHALTNRVYVPNASNKSIHLIAGATNAVATTVSVGGRYPS
jgi:YVTN family beta-propeller protein